MRLFAALALTTTDALAACPATLDTLAGGVEHAERLYADAVLGDGAAETLQRFLDAAAELQADVTCVDEVIAPPLAARLHQVTGLLRYTREDLDGAARAFAGARHADATVPFGEGFLHPGEPEMELYWRDDQRRTTWTSLPFSESTRFLVNGRPETRRPVDFPVILQEVDGAGVVLRTLVLEGDHDLVATVTLAPAPAPPSPAPPRPQRPVGALALTGVSAATLAAGAGVLGWSLWTYDRQCSQSGCVGAVAGDRTYSADQVVGMVRGGLGAGGALTALGVAGLAGSAVWLQGGPDGVAVSVLIRR